MFVSLVLAAFLSIICLSVWRVLHHPLRKFPGPPLAVLTTWYSGYYDVVKRGGLLRKITQLHDKYGDVIRIGPNELSFCDPKAFADIYAIGSKFTKEPNYYQCFGVSKSAFGSTDPHVSKFRRDLLSPLFSRRAILRLENVLQAKTDELISRLKLYGDSKKPVNLFMAFRCTSLEMITEYCLDQSLHALDYPDFEHPFLVSLQAAIPFFWVLKYVPWLTPILLNLPAWILSRVSGGIFDFRRLISTKIDGLVADPKLLERADHETIYHHLLASPEEKGGPRLSREEIFQEALAALLAGSDTVGNTCTVGVAHILSNRSVLQKLVKELQDSWPDLDSSLDYSTLEKLPYLTAVIKECLRVGHGVVSPMPRIVGPEDAIIGGYHVPAGTIVSMGHTFVHLNPDIFENPSGFSPERWLGPDAKNLEPWLVSFSKGPRSCLGMNLAWCELYLILGNIFRRLDLKLFETTIDDFRDFDALFVPVHKGKPLQVMAQSRLV